LKKKYTVPELRKIGDMVNNTLGASGGITDGASFQAGGNGSQSNSTQNNNSQNNNNRQSSFNNDSFNNSSFK
jgi:hypothetical protein